MVSSFLGPLRRASCFSTGLATIVLLMAASIFPLNWLAAAAPTNESRPSAPGEQVHWIKFPPQKSKSDKLWGKFLTDLENHLPAQYKDDFQADDRVAHAHETTHGIQAHIRNQHVNELVRFNSFYVGDDRAVLIEEPNIRLSDIATLVPEPLRQVRYKNYLVNQQKQWERDPLYLFDEWVAYGNGVRTGVELAKKGLYKPDKNDGVFAVLEFNVYAIYTVLATRKLDRKYDSRQLTEFLAWNLRRSMALYSMGYGIESFNWDNHEYYRQLHSGPAAKELRRFLRDLYGAAWCHEVMGFPKTE